MTVSHALGSYPVYIEGGALKSLPDLLERHLPGRNVALITDDRVGRLYDEWSPSGEQPRFAVRLTFPSGEASKTRESWQRLSDEMLDQRLGRDTAIVTLGGGVAGDLGGFVAATYLRGIPYAQVPTTLLAMLDASVGGKVGVDTPYGKNLIGAFHPPALVLIDPLTLWNLGEREYRCGLAEAVKHGLIADRAYFEWIEKQIRPLAAREPQVLKHLIRRSVEIKAVVVGEDEREAGRRAILNAGHTVAHALEVVWGYRIPHGEAVALGLIAECRMAEHLGVAPEGLTPRVAAVLSALGLPTRVSDPVERDPVLAAMASDKKNRSGVVRLALPAGLGQMRQHDGSWTLPVERTAIETGLDAIR